MKLLGSDYSAVLCLALSLSQLSLSLVRSSTSPDHFGAVTRGDPASWEGPLLASLGLGEGA